MRFVFSLLAAIVVMAGQSAQAQILINSAGTQNLSLAGYNGAVANLPSGVTAAFLAGSDGGLRERGFSQTGTSVLDMGSENPPNYNGAINSGGLFGWGSATGTTVASITESTLAFQATGGSASSSYTLTYQNNTGSVLDELTFAFTAYQWRRSTGSRLTEVILSSSISGFDPFTFAGTGSAAAATGRAYGDAAPAGFADDENYSSTVSGLNIADGDTFSFTFTFNRDGAVVGSGSAQGLAIGNISLSSSAIPEPSSLLLVSGLVGMGFFSRRRRS